jgi:N-acetylglutamate synthase and related acetyltransferases
MLIYCSIENQEAMNFLLNNSAHKEQISISRADFWLAAKDKATNKIVGIVGLLVFKNKIRIKAFYILKEYRNTGIGKNLIAKIVVPTETITVFSTKNSKAIFLELGFKEKSRNKNGIYFMEKVGENNE